MEIVGTQQLTDLPTINPPYGEFIHNKIKRKLTSRAYFPIDNIGS